MQKNNNKKNEQKTVYLLSFIIPVIIMIAVFALQGVWPFGDKTVMTGDTQYQFVDYLSYFRTILFGNNDLSYSFSKTLGGEMAGFTAYYFLSPLNLIPVLFPSKWLPVGISLVLVLAPGLCSVSMTYVLNRLHGFNKASLIFAWGYALMAYIVVYNELFQYYTNFILLPLIVLGIHRIFEDYRKNVPYILLLAFAVINNYYTGYMICIFCALYFFYRLCIEGFAGRGRTIMSFAISSVTAGGLSAFMLFPAVKSLAGEKNSPSIGFFIRFNPVDFFSKLYTGSFKGDFGTGLPNIYCGTAITVLIICYFFNKSIMKKEKILTGMFLVFFLINFTVNTLNVVWHGFNQPIGFPYRYAFLFTFFVIFTAYRGFIRQDGCNVKAAGSFMAVVFIIYSSYLLVSNNQNTSLINILIDLLIIVLVLAVLWFRPKKLLVFLMLIQAADLSLNAAMTMESFDLASMSEYQSYVEKTGAVIDVIKNEDNGMYRIEKYFKRSHNDAMMFNYAGLSHFSSSEKKSVMSFMQRMGFRNNGNWAFYNEGSTAFADCLLGVKYIVSQYDWMSRPYDLDKKVGDYQIIKNPYALPLIFSGNPEVRDISYEDYTDPFAFQEKVAESMTDTDEKIFEKAAGVKRSESDGGYSYDFTMDRDSMLEVYFTAPELQDAHLYVNGADYGSYFNTYRWNVVNIGNFKKGDKINIVLESESGEQLNVTEALIYYENTSALKSFYDKISSDKCSLSKITSSDLRGHYTSRNGCIMFSIPYDQGWSINVDGNKLSRDRIKEVAGELLSADVPAGSHDIELKFRSPGAEEGFTITCIFIFLLTIYIVVLIKDSKKIKKSK